MAKTWKFSALDTAHPAGSLRRLAILRALKGIYEISEPRLPFWKLIKLAERNPLVIRTLLLDRRQQISDDRHRNGRTDDCIERSPNP